MSKSVIIIGGGIAGLCSGIYARLNGFETDIYEMHTIAGGLCTAWKRGDYTFDGSLSWLTGTDTKSAWYKLWEDIGGVQGKEFFYYEYFAKVRDPQGNEMTFYTDPDKLMEQMMSIAPEDKKIIKAIIGDIKKFMKHEMPVEFRFSEILKFLPPIMLFYKYRISVHELAAKCKSPALRYFLIQSLDWHGMPVGFSLWATALIGSRNGGYPMGGSLGFIKSVVERYEQLGGRIHYHSKVEEILVENNTAKGIRLKNGEVKNADYILSAADGHSTIFEWLGGRYIDKRIQRLYNELEPFPPLVFVSFGINADYPNAPLTYTFPLEKPFNVGPDEIRDLTIKNSSFDPALCPRGKTNFTIIFASNYDHWEKLKQDKEKYLAEKKMIEENVISAVAGIFPGIKEKIEEIDVATPMTLKRYTGNFRGSYEGWLMTKKSMMVQLPQTLPGLSNFYMAGQWITPGGGLPTGLMTGRNAIKKICKKEGIKFGS
jgi:phytoene dehydrogenase-like protein